jgi:hypothetical protein
MMSTNVQGRRRRSRRRDRPDGLGTGLREFLWDLKALFRSKSKHTSGSHKRVVLLLVLGGAVLRGMLLTVPITADEAYAWKHFISGSFGHFISHHAHQGNHVLYSILASGTLNVLGTGLVALRLPAFVAGVLVLPLVYLFVRAQFNRYIALITLALVASSGGLVEYSALGRGFSITWLCFMAALLLGRHFVKTNNRLSALLLGVVSALGMWATPAMLHPAVAVFVWVLLSLLFRYDHTVGGRLIMLGISILVFIGATILCYAPVISEHGLGELLWHSTLGGDPREQLAARYQDMPMEFWYYINQTGAGWVSILGLLGLLFASSISSKYRLLLLAVFIGTAPVVVLQGVLGPPRVWLYTLLVLHISTGIALFYLLKFLQEKVWQGLAKRMRTIWTSALLFAAFGLVCVRVLPERILRQAAAAQAVEAVATVLQTGDRIASEPPWTPAMEFHGAAAGLDRAFFQGMPQPDAMLYLLVAPIDGQTNRSVLEHNGLSRLRTEPPGPLMERDGVRLLGARVLPADK